MEALVKTPMLTTAKVLSPYLSIIAARGVEVSRERENTQISDDMHGLLPTIPISPCWAVWDGKSPYRRSRRLVKKVDIDAVVPGSWLPSSS
jgi:hypothetical protein